MLEKLLNSMIYGNFKTKLFLWSIALMAVAALLLLMIGIVLGSPLFVAGGIGSALLGVITSQSISLNDLSKKKKKKNNSVKTKEKRENDDSANTKKTQENEEEDEGRSRRKREKEKAQYLASFDQKKLKKIMKEHKVNQIHVKVMIDSYPAKKIEQAPAFMWKTDTMLHFMILTGKAEEFEVPLDDIKGILLVKDIPVNEDKDYQSFKYSNYISKMFKPYLPEYFESGEEGKLQVKKNRFRIEPGIYLTNSSISNLRKVLLPGVAFLVDDQVIASKRFNEFFKEIYRQSVLCKNLIITLDEYKVQIDENLKAMLNAPISSKEFVTTLYDLNKYRLISREFVTKYSQLYRQKNIDL